LYLFEQAVLQEEGSFDSKEDEVIVKESPEAVLQEQNELFAGVLL
jgi:hypothetical protein